MKKKIRKLMGQALGGDGAACRKLGLCFLKGKGCKTDKRLARLFLEQAMVLGDEKSFFIYHGRYSKGKRVIDSASYEEMREDYGSMGEGEGRERLGRYLSLGKELLST